ncbi:MAG: hypothetical protein EBY86_07385 [Acidimicrobiia bacterium]|nr:hypothetical protein [Acidimicrobiia bacterium]
MARGLQDLNCWSIEDDSANPDEIFKKCKIFSSIDIKSALERLQFWMSIESSNSKDILVFPEG